eukprot:s371_g23.t4
MRYQLDIPECQWVLSPCVAMTWADEDFIGRISRLSLWPSEVAYVARAASGCVVLMKASRQLLSSPSLRQALLSLVAERCGAATAEAVLLAERGRQRLPWPRWQDALVVLQHCGLAVHQERRAMQVALRSGPVKAVKWLLSARADAEKPVEADLTPLRLAARFGNDEVVDTGQPGGHGPTKNGAENEEDTLLEGKAEPNTRGRFGYTALMVAAMYGHSEIVQLLLSKGAQVNTNGDGETAIDLAYRYPQVAQLLQRHVDTYGWTGSAPQTPTPTERGNEKGWGAAGGMDFWWIYGPLSRPSRYWECQAACSIVIIANSIHLAILSDDQIVSSYNAALHGGQEAEDVHFLDYFFASWFAVEIILRVIPKGPLDFFYYSQGWRWNCFDTAIALEAIAGLIARLGGAQISQLRVLGIFRLARLVKHMKKVKVLRKLRKTLLALVASLVDLFWAFLVVVLFLYVYSIFLSTATVHYFDNLNRTSATLLAGDELVEVQKVQDYYGSIISTMLSLWSAISGGNDWMEYAETLRTMGGTFYFASFIAFIAFCTIGLFNVVTGIFVDSAVEAAAMFRSDAEMIADHQEQKATEDDELNELVGLLGTDAGKYVRSDELDEHLKGTTAQAFWHSKMQLNPHQVKDMYILYSRLKPKTDTGKDGIKVEDFLHFTRTCKGQASYVDLLTLMHDQTRLGKFIHKEFEEGTAFVACGSRECSTNRDEETAPGFEIGHCPCDSSYATPQHDATTKTAVALRSEPGCLEQRWKISVAERVGQSVPDPFCSALEPPSLLYYSIGRHCGLPPSGLPQCHVTRSKTSGGDGPVRTSTEALSLERPVPVLDSFISLSKFLATYYTLLQL